MPSSSHPGAKPPRARQNSRPQQRPNTRPNQRGGRQQQQQHERPKPPTQVMLYGMHPVIEALNNPARRFRILWLDQGKERELTNIFEVQEKNGVETETARQRKYKYKCSTVF